MEKESTVLFLESLLERIETDYQTERYQLRGNISSHEIAALKNAIQLIKSELTDSSGTTESEKEETNNPEQQNIEGSELSENSDNSKYQDLELNLSSMNIEETQNNNIMLCLDFGTAMSKAFATEFEDGDIVANLGLKIGSRVSKSGMIYTIPSSLWISNDGILSFGENAIIQSLQNIDGKRQRFDSPKKELIQGLVETPLDKVELSPEINPTGISLSKGDAITIYLSYLTDLACSELAEKHNVSRYIKRRFALPSWDADRRTWGEKMLAKMLAKAQILADTFHDQWDDGIHINKFKMALDKINSLESFPNHLIDIGITEPLAAASSRLRKEDETRGLVMVIDVGAGTSDFGMFIVSENPKRNIYNAWAIYRGSESLQQAGDTLDTALQKIILTKAAIDISNPDYPYIVAAIRFRIREWKEELFRDGQCAFTLSNGERGIIGIQEFLDDPAVKRFSELLSDTFKRVLDQIDKSFLQRFDGDTITVICTGGGATLPMVTALSEGSFISGHYNLRKHRAPLVPEEFYDDEELSYVYPQLAVAIGGSQPDLINENDVINEMPGLERPTWEIGKTQITGV